MKTKIIVPVVLAFMAGTLLTSCSRTEKKPNDTDARLQEKPDVKEANQNTNYNTNDEF